VKLTEFKHDISPAKGLVPTEKGLFYGRFFSSRFITMKVGNQTNTQSVLVRLLLKVAQMRN
jgi:hypothetical protein